MVIGHTIGYFANENEKKTQLVHRTQTNWAANEQSATAAVAVALLQCAGDKWLLINQQPNEHK